MCWDLKFPINRRDKWTKQLKITVHIPEEDLAAAFTGGPHFLTLWCTSPTDHGAQHRRKRRIACLHAADLWATEGSTMRPKVTLLRRINRQPYSKVQTAATEKSAEQYSSLNLYWVDRIVNQMRVDLTKVQKVIKPIVCWAGSMNIEGSCKVTARWHRDKQESIFATCVASCQVLPCRLLRSGLRQDPLLSDQSTIRIMTALWMEYNSWESHKEQYMYLTKNNLLYWRRLLLLVIITSVSIPITTLHVPADSWP